MTHQSISAEPLLLHLVMNTKFGESALGSLLLLHNLIHSVARPRSF